MADRIEGRPVIPFVEYARRDFERLSGQNIMPEESWARLTLDPDVRRPTPVIWIWLQPPFMNYFLSAESLLYQVNSTGSAIYAPATREFRPEVYVALERAAIPSERLEKVGLDLGQILVHRNIDEVLAVGRLVADRRVLRIINSLFGL